MCGAGNRWVQSLWNGGRSVLMLARVRYPPKSPPPGVLCQRQTIFVLLIIPKHPRNTMCVYMEPLIDDLVKAWDEGVWTYDRATKKILECMFGTNSPCMTYPRMTYSAAGVLTGSSHVQHARQLCSSSG